MVRSTDLALHPGTCADVQSSADCIYKKSWQLPSNSASKGSRPSSQSALTNGVASNRTLLSADDDAKLVFGTVFSLRNMVRKLGGEDDR
jgi:hypothetical protein